MASSRASPFPGEGRRHSGPRSRSRSRSFTPRSLYSRSPSPPGRRDSHDRARSPRRNGRDGSPRRDLSRNSFRSRTRSISRSRSRSRSLSRSLTRSYTRPRSWSRDPDAASRSRSQSPRPAARSTKIVVERLSKNVNEEHLREIFSQYGEIEDLDLPIGRTTGMNRGSAYILFTTEADAENAIAHMHEAQLDGTVINVSIVLPRRKISPAPPIARRGAGPPAGPRPGGPRGAFGGPGPMDRSRRSPMPLGSTRFGPRSDTYRPRSTSRSQSRSPPPAANTGNRRYRPRSRSYSSRSRSRTRSPPGRGGHGSRRGYGRSRNHGGQGAREQRRSPSPASYDSYDRRSRSRSRSRDYERR